MQDCSKIEPCLVLLAILWWPAELWLPKRLHLTVLLELRRLLLPVLRLLLVLVLHPVWRGLSKLLLSKWRLLVLLLLLWARPLLR